MRKKNNKKNTKKSKNIGKEIIPKIPPISKEKVTSNENKLFDFIKKPALRLYGLILIIGAFLSLTGFGYFESKVDVSFDPTLDENDPFATLVQVHNTGNFDMTNVKLTLEADSIEVWNVKDKDYSMSMNGIEIDNDALKTELIRKDKYWTSNIPFKPTIMIGDSNVRFKYADIEVILKYRHLYHDIDERFRLVGVLDKNKKIIWTRQP